MGKKRSLADANVDNITLPETSKKLKTIADESSNTTDIPASDVKKAKKDKKKNKQDKLDKEPQTAISEPESVAEQQAVETIQSNEERSSDQPEKPKKKKKSKKNKEADEDLDIVEDSKPEVNGTSSTPKATETVETLLDEFVNEPTTSKKKRKSKQNKEADTAVETTQAETKTDEPAPALAEAQEVSAPTKKPKRRRKKNKSTTDTATDTNAENPSEAADPQQKAVRFICFIGNLPFTATKDSIAKHFEAVEPASIRAPTKPDTKQSKGYAFLEFDRYDRMKSCLASYHHSKFEDGISPSRRINVELTYVILNNLCCTKANKTKCRRRRK